MNPAPETTARRERRKSPPSEQSKGLPRPAVRAAGAATLWLILALLVISGGAGACAALKSSSSELPAWRLSDAPRADEGHFYGTGCAPARISNQFFQRDTARERARVDLAHAVHEFALSELDGDTIAARRVVERTLPGHEVIDRHRDEEGNLCMRSRLSRPQVEKAIREAGD